MTIQAGNAGKTEMKNKIREFVISNFLLGADTQVLNDDTSFLEQGIVDSTGILELVSFVQEAFDIRIEDMELMPENLDSLNKLEAFIAKKKQGCSDASV
jgi:acyl carrier protein